MRTGGLVRVIAFLLSVPPAAGQGPVADRLRGRVPPEVAAAVERLAREAAAQGLPVEPLVQKAVEGGAKGVPGPRVVAAVEALAARLESAARAVRAGGATPDPATIEAAAFVLSLGLGETQVARLVQVGRPGRDRAVVLRVAGALVALGVPAGESVDLLVGELEAGRPEAELVDLPARVQAGL
ncbi:MAG TPA: hypothetical protein VNI61_12570, partial [Gemmatimonadales bacterium]|nr:hypothetical protein [Gemmatimonadales bacterium]